MLWLRNLGHRGKCLSEAGLDIWMYAALHKGIRETLAEYNLRVMSMPSLGENDVDRVILVSLRHEGEL